MQHLLPGNRRQVGVDGEAGNPGELLAGEDKGPAIALFARHSGIDKDVLELARAAAAGRPESKAGSPETDPQLKARPKVGGLTVVAAGAGPNLEAGRVKRRALGRDDFHVIPHDTETQAAGKIDASPAKPGADQAQHRREVGPGQSGRGAAGFRVEQLEDFHGRGLRHGPHSISVDRTRRAPLSGLLPRSRSERRRVETSLDARPVALERRENLESRTYARKPGVEVRRVLMRHDLPLVQELAHFALPNVDERTHVMAAPGRHAAKPREPASAQ